MHLRCLVRPLYNYRRDYDPATGRYVEADPIGLAAGTNLYTYVSNKPTAFADPSGLVQCDVIGYRRTPWQEIPGSRETPWYELINVFASDIGLTGSCQWARFQWLKEQRTVYMKVKCWECDILCNGMRCGWHFREFEQGKVRRSRKDVDLSMTPLVKLNLVGGDPESPTNWICSNPTGRPHGGSFQDGP